MLPSSKDGVDGCSNKTTFSVKASACKVIDSVIFSHVESSNDLEAAHIRVTKLVPLRDRSIPTSIIHDSTL